MTVPDYSHYLSPDMLARTEIEWSRMDRTELIALIMSCEPTSVVEFCCGTGWIPKGLPNEVEYLGVDANEGCIKLARSKNPTRPFQNRDVREFHVMDARDLALGFSCLKHFSLAEWNDIYGRILRAGNKTITSIYMSPTDKEDEHHGFPHTSVTLERVERVCAENGHRVVKVMTLPPLNTQPEPLVLTERIPEEEPEEDAETGTVTEEVLGDTSTGRTKETITKDDVGDIPQEILDGEVSARDDEEVDTPAQARAEAAEDE